MTRNDLTIKDCYFYKGEMFINKECMMLYFGVSQRTVEKWIVNGMPKHEVDDTRLKQLFLLKECVAWHHANIRPSNTHSTLGNQANDGNDSLVRDIEAMSYAQLEHEEKRLKVQLAKVKLEEAEAKLVSADELDKALYEQAIMHITKLNNDEKVLPIILEQKQKDEISKLLHEHNAQHLETLSSNIEKKFKKDPSNYDVFNYVLELRKKFKPKDLISYLEKISVNNVGVVVSKDAK